MAPVRTVFVVDDDASVRSSLERLLRSAGFSCKTFADGSQFLDQWSPGTKGCLIVDLSMYPMSGLELQAQLRAEGIDLPTIVLSASDDAERRRVARSFGARFFFRKPVDDQALIDAISWIDEPHDHPDPAVPVPPVAPTPEQGVGGRRR